MHDPMTFLLGLSKCIDSHAIQHIIHEYQLDRYTKQYSQFVIITNCQNILDVVW